MNTSKIKTYAIQARRDFIKAVTERANTYGIFSDDHIEPIEFKGDAAIIGERAFPKKEGELREKLVGRIKRDGFTMVIRSCAYTWFNRFVALRYMEIHGYLEHGFRVLSNSGGSVTPEILEHAADINFQGIDKDKVIELKLAGTKDNELYRLLILAQCDDLNKSMPFLFDRIDNETELLLPDNLLHSDSPIRKMVTEIDESGWNDVEIIGWIYQFYISERKDEVIGKVVKSEDIPAATQLFTPNWIVKYMVQNTLGRMWLATYPDSPLKDKMEYYIEPAAQEPEVQKQLDENTPKELNPEEITFLDPACGSGHVLVEAYDVLKEIYLERGYRTRDVPQLVIGKNLHGLDICDRAGQLSCFAILMKAREDDRKILDRDNLKLNVMAIQTTKPSDTRNIELFFKKDELENIRRDLKEIVALFENGKIYGSLIAVPDNLDQRIVIVEKAVDEKIGKWISHSDVQNLAALVKQARILTRKYDCVVTNPPYMGGKGMNLELKDFAKKRFPDSKSDLFSMFIERCLQFSKVGKYVSLVTMEAWMFLSSYTKLREKLVSSKTIKNLIHNPYEGKHPTSMGINFGISSFSLINKRIQGFNGAFTKLRYTDLNDDGTPQRISDITINHYCRKSHNFKKIPGCPIAYWASRNVLNVFEKYLPLEDVGIVRQGASTSDNARFLRLWYEVSNSRIGYKIDDLEQANNSEFKWFPYNKGGEYRKWYGNQDFIINYENDGYELKEFQSTLNQGWTVRLKSREYYFKPSVSWPKITSGLFSARYYPLGFIFDVAGCCFFPYEEATNKVVVSFLNSKVSKTFLQFLSPTLNYEIEQVKKLPYTGNISVSNLDLSRIYSLSQSDWNSSETSWDFTKHTLLHPDYRQSTLKGTYQNLRAHWRDITLEMQRLEEENNRIFIDAYGLHDELTSDVPFSEITLTCNPRYRYNGNKTKDELETLLLTDTIKELISYAMGCMMGRYSLDQPGLNYAHSNNIDFDPSKYKTFPTDDDGIIPIMDQEWFPDDAANRFVDFLKVAWPHEALDENLKFVADSLKPKRNETSIETIRRYLSTTFFKDHLKTYKKRPIYWLFSSGKQKAFECLVYLHRYNESTLSRMRSTYVTPLQSNFSSRLEFLQDEKDAASTTSAKNKIQKEIDKLKKKQTELSNFDDELRHYADKKISLDLDDGVKVNYDKFGKLLAEKKAITGKK